MLMINLLFSFLYAWNYIKQVRYSSKAKENNDLAQKNQTYKRKKYIIKIIGNKRKKITFLIRKQTKKL